MIPPLIRRACVLAVFITSSAVAQDTTGILVGARLRIEATRRNEGTPSRYTLVGDLEKYDQSYVFLRQRGITRLDTVPIALVRYAWVSREFKSHWPSTRRGALIGGLIGAGAYALTVYVSNQSPDYTDDGQGGIVPVDDKYRSENNANRRIARTAVPILVLVGAAFGYANTGEQWLRFTMPGGLGPQP